MTTRRDCLKGIGAAAGMLALKEQGRVRYIGVTTTFEGQYDALLRTVP